MSASHYIVILLTSSLLMTYAGAEDDYYDILGLPERDETAERDIKAAWRKLSKLHHPDLSGEENRGLYQKIQRAYEVLGDRKKRKVYDIRGEEGLKQLSMPNQGQSQDPFSQIFGGMGGGGGNKKGADINMLMLVTLEDMYNGAAHSVKLKKQKICRTCRGTGAASKSDLVTCSKCNGNGHIIQKIEIMPGFMTQQHVTCPKCKGKKTNVGKKCPTCKGKCVVKGPHTLHIDVEQGTPENFDLRYEMDADQAPDEIPGDVIFSITSAPHPVFTRKGNNLEASVNITLKESLLGFVKSLAHLDGHEVELDESGVVQYNQKYIAEDEGMPIHHVPSEKGTLTVTYKVNLPESLTEEMKEKIRLIFPS
eukprot:Tbor_TRINITY_DN4631_c0_g1::TRINITY_DN4631_c0_g1_i2::g.14960::m.14960/K14002/SCJ1; DnaJ-related protein SCJ1